MASLKTHFFCYMKRLAVFLDLRGCNMKVRWLFGCLSVLSQNLWLCFCTDLGCAFALVLGFCTGWFCFCRGCAFALVLVVHPWYGLTGGRVAVVSAGSSAGEADLERPSTSATSGWRTTTSAEAGARQASSASQSWGVAPTPWEESLTGQEVSV